MRALVVAPQPFFSPRGTPLSVYYRTLVTAELGVEVDLLTYGEGQDVEIPGVRIVRIPRLPGLHEIRVGPSFAKLVLDAWLLVWAVGLLTRRRYDFVHAHEEAVFFCRFLKPLFRFRLVYDMHSSLPHQLENFRFTRSRLLIGFFRRLEASALRSSDAVITICPDLADYARERMPDTRRHFLIENSILDEVKLVGDELPDGADRDRPTVPALAENAELVVYAGTLEPYQGIELLLQAFAGVGRREPRAFLLVVGGSPAQVEHFRELAWELGLEGRCHFTGKLSHRRARDHSRRASVLVSPRIEGTNTPLKIYEQLASGVPIVATDIHAHSQVLSPEVAFLAYPEPEAFSDALVAALTRDDERSRRADAARRLYQERYSRAVYRERLAQMLNALR